MGITFFDRITMRTLFEKSLAKTLTYKKTGANRKVQLAPIKNYLIKIPWDMFRSR